MGIAQNILDSGKIILTVLGLSSPYPNVDIKNVGIYQTPNIVVSEFQTQNIVNKSIKSVIESGMNINIVYSVKTTAKRKILYTNQIKSVISCRNKMFYISKKPKGYKFSDLTNSIVSNEIIILTNTPAHKNKQIKTEIEILISCEGYSDLSDLWGNQPKITLSYGL